MDNFIPELTFVCLLIVGIMVSRLQREVKELKKLLEEYLKLSRRIE